MLFMKERDGSKKRRCETQNITGNLYLYHVNGKKIVQENSNVDLFMDGTDKWCSFYVTHNSKFFVSGGKLMNMKNLLPPKKIKLSNWIYYLQDTSNGTDFKRMTLNGKKVETIYANK